MRHTETQIQSAIVRWLRFNRFLCTSTGAGLIKSVKTQITMRKCGYLPGSPDIIVWIPGGTLNIEVKRPEKMKYSFKTNRLIVANSAGRQSESQKDFEDKVKKIQGHHYIVVTDVQQVAEYIKSIKTNTLNENTKK